MTKKKDIRIYRYYNGIYVGTCTEKWLYHLDINRADRIVGELKDKGQSKYKELLYSTKKIIANPNSTNISSTKHIGGGMAQEA